MSYTSVNGVTNTRGLINYLFFGKGPEATKRQANHKIRARAFKSDLPVEQFVKLAEQLQSHKGYKNGAMSIVQSFDNTKDHLDPNNPDDWQYVNDMGYELAKRLHPNSPCLVVTHNDGDRNELHNHIVILNYDLEKSASLRENRQIYKIRQINDELMRENGFQIIKPQLAEQKQTALAKRNLDLHGPKWVDQYDFDTLLQDSIEKAFKHHPKNTKEMVKCLADEGVEVDFKPYEDHAGNKQYGVVYKMMDQYGTGTRSSKRVNTNKARKRRRKASALGRRYMLDQWEKIFDFAKQMVKKVVPKTVQFDPDAYSDEDKKKLNDAMTQGYGKYIQFHPGAPWYEYANPFYGWMADQIRKGNDPINNLTDYDSINKWINDHSGKDQDLSIPASRAPKSASETVQATEPVVEAEPEEVAQKPEMDVSERVEEPAETPSTEASEMASEDAYDDAPDEASEVAEEDVSDYESDYDSEPETEVADDAEATEGEAEEKRKQKREAERKAVIEQKRSTAIDKLFKIYGYGYSSAMYDGFDDALREYEATGASLDDFEYTDRDFEVFNKKHEAKYEKLRIATNKIQKENHRPLIPPLKYRILVDKPKVQTTKPRVQATQATKPAKVERPKIQSSKPKQVIQATQPKSVAPAIDIESENPALYRHMQEKKGLEDQDDSSK